MLKNTTLNRSLATAALLVIANTALADDTADLKAENKALNERLTQVEKLMKQDAAASPVTAKNDDAAPQSGLSTGRPILSLTNSTVSVYGQIDATIGSYSGVPKSNGTLGWKTGALVGALNPDKWGILAEHVLDRQSGLKIIGNLEGEFETPTGNSDTPGTIFNRQAWVGFKSDAFGQLIFGRNNPVAKDFDGIWADPFHENTEIGYGGGGYTNNNNFKYPVWYIGLATGTHADSNLQYKKVMGPWVLGLDYQFGGNQRRGDVASGFQGSFATNSGEQIALAYNGNGYHVSGHYGRVNRADKLHQSWTLGGGMHVNPILDVNGGFIHYTAEQAALGKRTDNAVTLSAKLSPGGTMTYEFGYVGVDFNNAAANGDGSVMRPFLSDTSDPVANLANGAGSGKMQTLFAGARYHFDKTTQLYLIVDRMNVGNGIKINGFYDGQFGGAGKPRGQTEVLAGVSWRF